MIFKRVKVNRFDLRSLLLFSIKTIFTYAKKTKQYGIKKKGIFQRILVHIVVLLKKLQEENYSTMFKNFEGGTALGGGQHCVKYGSTTLAAGNGLRWREGEEREFNAKAIHITSLITSLTSSCGTRASLGSYFSICAFVDDESADSISSA